MNNVRAREHDMAWYRVGVCQCVCVCAYVHACVRARLSAPYTIHFALNLHSCKRPEERAPRSFCPFVIRLILRWRRTKLGLRLASLRTQASQTLPLLSPRPAQWRKVTVCAFSISFMAEGNVNCAPLPLNCSLVVLITVLIDAEIELLPRAIEGANQRWGWRMKDYHGSHIEMAPL